MTRPIKFLVWFIAALAALFAVVAVAFLFLFDPNDFRDDVERMAEESTGRELTISGDVSLQIFPWLAVEIGESRLGNAPGFGDEPFAAFDSVTLSVQIMPLILRREVVVGTAEIDGLQLNLAARADGSNNWSDLAAAGDAEPEADAASADEGTGGAIEISGAAIRDATINYTSGNDRYSLTEANLSIGAVSADSDALTVGAVSIAAVIAGATEMPTTFEFATDGIAVDLAGEVATIEPIDISILGIDLGLAFEPIAYAGDLDARTAVTIEAFSPRSVMTQLGITPPEMADPNALSMVSVDATASVGESSAGLTGATIRLDDTTFSGAMTVPFDPAGRFRLQLEADAIDLNRYLTVSDEAAAAPEEGVPMEIPAELIAPLNAQGDLKIGSVRIGNLELVNVAVGLNAANGRMRIHPVSAGLFGGSYTGDVRIDVSGAKPVLSMNETVAGVDLAKLAMAMFEQQNVTGSIDGNFKLGGRGNDMNEIRETLRGTMSFELKDGSYEGTDVWHELRRARAMFKGEEPPRPSLPARTQFTSVSASGVVSNGVLRNEDFRADLPFMQVTGSGEVNLGAGTVDYGLRARVLSKPELMGDVTSDEIDDLTKTVIPMRISGPLTSPTVAPDLEALLRERVEEEIKEKLGDKLKDLFRR